MVFKDLRTAFQLNREQCECTPESTLFVAYEIHPASMYTKRTLQCTLLKNSKNWPALHQGNGAWGVSSYDRLYN